MQYCELVSTLLGRPQDLVHAASLRGLTLC